LKQNVFTTSTHNRLPNLHYPIAPYRVLTFKQIFKGTVRLLVYCNIEELATLEHHLQALFSVTSVHTF